MLGRLKGILLEKQPPEILLDVQGVGYELLLPMTSFYDLPEIGQETTLFTHLVVREDAHLLFGFAQKTDRTLFRELIKTNGVGPKLAVCILLFSTLKRFEVFPIDVWVRRVMNELYIKNEDETKVNKKELEKLAHEKFGNLAGIAQQYLFYWKREA